MFSKDRIDSDSIEDLKRDFPDDVGELEESQNIYIYENDFKILETEFPDNWNDLGKIAYPSESFNGFDEYKQPDNNIKKEDCISELMEDYPNDKEKERNKNLLIFFHC